MFLKQIKCILCGIALTLFLSIDNSTQAVWPVIPNVLLSAEPAIVLPPPSGGTIIPFPTPTVTAPTPPTIIGGPQPIMLPPSITQAARNPNPPQVSKQYSTKKEAFEKWKTACERDYKGGGGGSSGGPRKPTKSEHHPSGHKGDSRPHYQTDRKLLKPNTPQKHFYYPKSVTVAPGDSLWKIAKKYGLDHNNLAKINGITDPKKLMPGQVIKLG